MYKQRTTTVWEHEALPLKMVFIEQLDQKTKEVKRRDLYLTFGENWIDTMIYMKINMNDFWDIVVKYIEDRDLKRQSKSG